MKKITHHVKRHVHKVRQQPEHVRRRILHMTIAISTVILLSLWLALLGRNLSREETIERTREDLEPLSALKDNLVGGYKSITETE